MPEDLVAILSATSSPHLAGPPLASPWALPAINVNQPPPKPDLTGLHPRASATETTTSWEPPLYVQSSSSNFLSLEDLQSNNAEGLEDTGKGALSKWGDSGCKTAMEVGVVIL
jgi:hypothetical protein